MAGEPGGPPAGDRDAEAGRALDLLRHAAATGHRDLASYRGETALDWLRSRPGFQVLIMDLNFPTNAFAP